MENRAEHAAQEVTVLVVEDSPTQAWQLRHILEQEGYRVALAANGREALDAARRSKPDLVVSDVVMPEMDGYQLSRQVKTDPELGDVPVILVTTLSDPQDVIRGLECCADNFILKPYDERYLLSCVRFVLANREMRRSERVGMGVEIFFNGQRHFITADRLQILNLLLSTYEAAVQRNRELESSREELRLLNARLESANRELESFSYSVSHDLRAPLRAIDGFARILEEDHGGRLDEEGRRLLKVIRDSSRKMGQLIDDLLSFSRLGRKPISAAQIDMTRQARAVFEELASEAGPVRLEMDALPEAWGDPSMVRQVWANLLSNAIKFSGKRPDPVVTVSGSAGAEENSYCVTDNGVGFDMRYYDKLFEVFHRLHGEEDYPGTGVGLAIVQRVVARHGGRVWAESRIGEGASFHFTLPRRKS